jgi:hypothetical protein
MSNSSTPQLGTTSAIHMLVNSLMGALRSVTGVTGLTLTQLGCVFLTILLVLVGVQVYTATRGRGSFNFDRQDERAP